MPRGRALIAEIDATALQPNQLACWWLGQASFALKMADQVFYVDLFLSPHPDRLVPPPLQPEEVTNAFALTASHAHLDHFDPPTLRATLRASPQAKVILPLALLRLAQQAGLPGDRVVPLRGDDSAAFAGAQIHAIPAAHEELDVSPDLGFPYQGYAITVGPLTCYHSGDSVPYIGLEERLARIAPHVMFLPVNGRDDARRRQNIVGNFTYEETVKLAAAVRPQLLVPMHYGMFASNTIDIQQFIAYADEHAPHVRYVVPTLGERLLFTAEL